MRSLRRGFINNWPQAAVDLYGHEPELVLGEELTHLPADGDRMATDDAPLFERARTTTVETEDWHRRADGSVFWARCTVSPLQSGQVDGYAVVCRDVTEQRRRKQHLQQQRNQLEQAIDVISHDLRNPLNVITSRLELFERTGDTAHLDTIAETTERIVAMPEPTDLDTAVETAWEGPGTTTADCEYVPTPTLRADPDRLIELLENLFRNAVEHGGRDVSVRIGPMENGFFVEDDGPGIPEDERDVVFEHGVTTADEGTGVGLSIVRTIAEAHDWDIGGTDTPLGGVGFEFPGVEFVTR